MGMEAWVARAVLEAPAQVNNRLREVFRSFRNLGVRIRIDNPRPPRQGKINV